MLAFTISLASLLTVRCDLPVHTRLPEIIGDWAFTLLPLTQAGYKDTDLPPNLVSTCGSGIPNHNSENLYPDLQRRYVEWLSESFGVDKRSGRHLVVGLGVARGTATSPLSGRDRWQSLTASEKNADDGNSSVGHWTMIYDEGFEIQLPHRRLILTAFIKYTLDEGCRGSEDAAEGVDGHTECYQTHPDETLLGWFQQGDEQSSKSIYGCVKGKKISPAFSSSKITHQERQSVVNGKMRTPKTSVTLEHIRDSLQSEVSSCCPHLRSRAA